MNRYKKISLGVVAALFISPLFGNIAFGTNLAHILPQIPNDASYNSVKLFIFGYSEGTLVCGSPPGGDTIHKGQNSLDTCHVNGTPDKIPTIFYLDIQYSQAAAKVITKQVINPDLSSPCKIQMTFPSASSGNPNDITASPACIPETRKK